MNKFNLFLVLGVVCLLAVNVNAVHLKVKPRVKSSPVRDNSDTAYKAVCTSADRGNVNCGNSFSISEGCLCYNNGTCIDTYVNRCQNCTNDAVFSVLEGKTCPRTQEYLCQPPVPGVKYSCVQQTYQSCVCSLNGTCFERNASHCIDCENPNILAVFENKSCPAQYLQTPPSKYFVPDACDKSGAKSVSCLKTQTPGCVCYSNNNTCEYRTDSNKCLLCFNKDVASFNQGEYCPKLNGKMFVCDGSSDNTCKSTKSSCVCDSDGSCSVKKTNHCKACQNDVASVIEGDQCPAAHYAPLQARRE